ncbi:uncharacterized protein LOC128894847 [Hylaeus anthracinus]|uniref:uncharacterized protein LOC128894847 n=1 Tax=Hylaeus anthracinus TaxID=313031 RepID=UPI0023BA0FC8|nr:uncharacterized protein LOC128894847 [Hylaeus anthracinus]
MERGSRSKKKPSKTEKAKGLNQVPEAPLVLGSRNEPLPDAKEQYLFFLEFLVDHVVSDRLAKLNQMFFVPTTICIDFLNFSADETVEITPVDPLFQPQAGVADDVEYFYSGRSVLFAIDQRTAVNKIVDFVVKLCVQKKMPDGVKPDVLIGKGELDLTKHFAALRKEMLQCWNKMAPPPKCFEGGVPLMYNDVEVGCVCMFVRISAFGQTIVTEFEAPPDMDVSAYIFKGDQVNNRSLSYKCRVIDSKDADIGRDSTEDVTTGGPPCRVCVKEEHPCSPCGQPIGATIKPNAGPSPRPITEADERPMPTIRSHSKPETCADVHKSGLIQSSRGSAQPCGKAVVLKVSGVLDTGSDKKPTVTVASEAEAAGRNPCDPDHDVFVLRIGKKGIVGADEKSDIQLEMRTPKGVEKGPPIRHETREMQTDERRTGKKRKRKKK